MIMETAKDETVKIVVFRLGGEEFGVDISQVNRIIKMDAITRIPNTPPYILGVLNLRGGIIVIIDLAMKLGFQSRRSDRNTRIIDVELGSTVVGMVVDSATELLTISRATIQPAPSIIMKKINGEYINGVAIIDQRILIILDLTKVLNTEELAGLSSIRGNPEDKKVKPSLAIVHPHSPVELVGTPEIEAGTVAGPFTHPSHAGDLPQHPF